MNPTLSKNGTPRSDLASQYSAARIAIQDAIAALAKVEFNSRDYLHVWHEARAEREQVFSRLRQVEAHITEIEMSL